MCRVHLKQLVHARSTHLGQPVCRIHCHTPVSARLLPSRADRNESQATSVTHGVNTGLLLASVFAGLAAASGALAIDSSGYQQWLQQQQGLEVLQESMQVSEADSSSRSSTWGRASSPFDVALASVIRLADTLSQATGEFVDLTEVAEAAELSETDTTHIASSSILDASYTAQPTYQLINRHRAAVSSIAAAEQGDTAALGVASSLPHDTYIGVASRMSQQAMAVAGEALKLATLLDSQEKYMDPTYRSLLQQIIEAARNVSAVAADIAQPGEWTLDDELGGSAEGGNEVT